MAKRHRWRCHSFTLRQACVIAAVVCAALAWFANVLQEVSEEKQRVATLRRAGWAVDIAGPETATQQFLSHMWRTWPLRYCGVRRAQGRPDSITIPAQTSPGDSSETIWQSLSHLDSVSSLNFAPNALSGDPPPLPLLELQNLVEVSFSNTVAPRGLHRLLVSARLQGLWLATEAASDQMLSNLLPYNSKVKWLNLGDARLSPSGYGLLGSFPALQRLNITVAPGDVPPTLELTNLPKLSELVLHGGSAVRRVHLSSMPKLTELVLFTDAISGQAHPHSSRSIPSGAQAGPVCAGTVLRYRAFESIRLEGLPALPEVSLSAREINVTNLPALHVLAVHYCNDLEFANQEALETLFIHQSDISDATLARIGSTCNVEELLLSYCPEITDHGVQAVLSTGTIRSLTIEYCDRITSGMIPALCRTPQLQELTVRGIDLTDSDIRRLVECHQLKRLTVDAHCCSRETAMWLKSVNAGLSVTRNP